MGFEQFNKCEQITNYCFPVDKMGSWDEPPKKQTAFNRRDLIGFFNDLIFMHFSPHLETMELS